VKKMRKEREGQQKGRSWRRIEGLAGESRAVREKVRRGGRRAFVRVGDDGEDDLAERLSREVSVATRWWNYIQYWWSFSV
jgi:hypothetical protein